MKDSKICIWKGQRQMKRIIKWVTIIFISIIIIAALIIGLIIKYGFGVSQQGQIYVASTKEDTSLLSKKEQFINDFDFLYTELKENYILFDYKQQVLELDLEKEYQSYREKIKNVNNDRHFYALCSKFVRLFEDG